MDEETVVVDVIPDELALARAQLDSGLPLVAEGQLRGHLARLEAEGAADEEADAVRVLLAEALWRQGRVVAAGAVLEGVRPSSAERRRPIAQVVRAEALAAAGDLEGAQAVVDRVVEELGAEGAWRVRGGMPSRLAWPLPPILRPAPDRPAGRGPFVGATPVPAPERRQPAQSGERVAAARGRLEAARQAYAREEIERGDRELSVAVRLDASVSGEGVSLLEPTLGDEPDGDRLLLYGDLLRAAGRLTEADAAYDRAAGA
jgi:hypothetical protein